MKTNDLNIQSERRSFLKKSAYVAPAILAMGQLTANAHADGSAVFTKNGAAGTEGGAIVVTKPDGSTTVITPPVTSPLNNFNNFLHHSH
jgi:predicted outer membrane repeat protein